MMLLDKEEWPELPPPASKLEIANFVALGRGLGLLKKEQRSREKHPNAPSSKPQRFKFSISQAYNYSRKEIFEFLKHACVSNTSEMLSEAHQVSIRVLYQEFIVPY